VEEEIKRMIDWMAKQELNDRQIEEVIEAILSTQDEKGKNIKKIFVTGLGRSGFVADGFAMRLSHLGFNTRTLKEPTAPPVEKGDLFIVVSGSGASLISQIEIALKIGAKVIVITSLADSMGARLADIKFIIPGREKEAEAASLSYDERQMRGLPIFPLGTAFEDFAMIVLDAIISQLILIKKKSEKDLEKQHINIQER
jgi:6-phospho-3-hexuloisomerase